MHAGQAKSYESDWIVLWADFFASIWPDITISLSWRGNVCCVGSRHSLLRPSKWTILRAGLRQIRRAGWVVSTFSFSLSSFSNLCSSGTRILLRIQTGQSNAGCGLGDDQWGARGKEVWLTITPFSYFTIASPQSRPTARGTSCSLVSPSLDILCPHYLSQVVGIFPSLRAKRLSVY